MAEEKTILDPIDEDFYDAADKPFDFAISEGETALVCESDASFRKKISDALLKEEYLVTEAESVKDALRKMRFHTYEVIVVNESFGLPQQDAGDILRHLETLGMATRRKIFLALVTNRFRTMDNMAAFNLSVNMVINTKNMDDVEMILKRGISENASFYYVFKETLKKEGRA